MTQTFLRQGGEGDGLGVGHFGALVFVGDEHEVHSVGEAWLEVAEVHLVIVMVEQLAELGDLEMLGELPSSLSLSLLFYRVPRITMTKNSTVVKA